MLVLKKNIARFKKLIPKRMGEYHQGNLQDYVNITLATIYYTYCNATMIPSGKRYNVIGLDVDTNDDIKNHVSF